MSDNLVKMDHLRAALQKTSLLTAEVARTSAEAIEELNNTKQDATSAVTMEQVNAAIRTAIIESWEGSY